MGLFDLPAPLFSIPTALLSGLLPPALLILLWGVVGGIVGVELYRLFSPQRRLAALKSELSAAQQQLSTYDGEFAGAWPLMGRMLRLAFGRLALVLPAAILSSLPLLALIVWLDTVYGRSLPPAGEPVATTTSSADFEARWNAPTGNEVPHVVVTDRAGQTVADVAVGAPVSRIEKRRWWNLFWSAECNERHRGPGVWRLRLSAFHEGRGLDGSAERASRALAAFLAAARRLGDAA
jgi:hypothetical protein